MREKLIALIRKADKEDHESQTQDVHYAFMADHLIANGVTIPVRCKECKYAKNMAPIGESKYVIGECFLREEDDICFMVYDDDFCSYGEKREV